MLFANDIECKRIQPAPHMEAWCPMCNGVMIPKCGKIKIWHWSHRSVGDCNTKLETEWHRVWKKKAMDDGNNIEVNFGSHIADIHLRNIKIIELQNSPISVDDMLNRCEFYKKMHKKIDWIFNYTDKYNKGHLKIWLKCGENGSEFCTFRQLWKKHHINYLFNEKLKPKYGFVYFDMGYDLPLLFIKKLYDTGSGYGYLVSRESLLGNFRKINFDEVNSNVFKISTY